MCVTGLQLCITSSVCPLYLGQGAHVALFKTVIEGERVQKGLFVGGRGGTAALILVTGLCETQLWVSHMSDVELHAIFVPCTLLHQGNFYFFYLFMCYKVGKECQ